MAEEESWSGDDWKEAKVEFRKKSGRFSQITRTMKLFLGVDIVLIFDKKVEEWSLNSKRCQE